MDPAAIFAVESSSDESEPEEAAAPSPPRPNYLLDFQKEQGMLLDRSRIPVEEQCRKMDGHKALGLRRSALGKNDQDAQASILFDQSEFLIALLEKIRKELEAVSDLPSFLVAFKEIAIKHMRTDGNERLIPLGRDLYIMAGMMLGLFRNDEDFRTRYKQILNFEMHNFHKEAEAYLINEGIQERDRVQAEKRKASDENEELQSMVEAEERKRDEEETDEQVEREIEQFLDLACFDTIRYQWLVFNGKSQKEAQEQCEREAREYRINCQKEVEVRSSPPRSEADPTDITLDLEAIQLEYSVHTPRHCPDAHIRPSDLDEMLERAGAISPIYAPEDVDMVDEREDRREEDGWPDAEEYRGVDHRREDRARQPRGDYADHYDAYGREHDLRAADYRDEEEGVGQAGDASPRYVHELTEAERQWLDFRDLEPEEREQKPELHHSVGDVQRRREDPRLSRMDHRAVDGAAAAREARRLQEQHEAAMRRRIEDRTRERSLSMEREQTARPQRTPMKQEMTIPDSPASPDEKPVHRSRPRTRSQERRERMEQLRATAMAPPTAASRPPNARRSASPAASRRSPSAQSMGRGRSQECTEQEPPEALNQDYLQPLDRVDMMNMVSTRESEEKWKRMQMQQRLEPIGNGQYMYSGHVRLSDHIVLEKPPKPPRVDYGVRPVGGLKSCLIHKRGAPPLLTDIKADRLNLPDGLDGNRLREQLLAVQRSYVDKPRKKVTFRPADDPLHQMRCYEMQACQVVKKKRILFDPTDDGFDKFLLDKPMSFLRELLKGAVTYHKRQERSSYLQPLATIQRRWLADDCHVANAKYRRRNRYYRGPLALPVTQRQDVIYTRATAVMNNKKKPEFQEYEVSHRNYKILLAMKPMPDVFIKDKWLPELRLYLKNAFAFELNKKTMRKAAGNAGLSHLIFADSLLDRVNTLRCPQSYFVIHQHPLTLSTSFRVLCNEIPPEKLLNIEWFIFAYGFDEIVFQNEYPKVAAERVVQHVMGTMQLYYNAAELLRTSHRQSRRANFRVFKLPTEKMDKRILPWIEEFNRQLEDLEKYSALVANKYNMRELTPFMFKVLDWDNDEIVKETRQVGISEYRSTSSSKDRGYRYNCIDSFLLQAHHHCEMRTARAIRRFYRSEYHESRKNAKVHGLSEDEHNRYY